MNAVAIITIAFLIGYIMFFLFCMLISSMIRNYDKRKFDQYEKEKLSKKWRKISKI